MARFKWTPEKTKAAELIGDGQLTDMEIADEVGVSRQVIWAWRKIPEFMAVVEAHLEGFRNEVRRIGLANRENRVRTLNDRWRRLNRVVQERADDPKLANIPGGTTGLIVHDVKGVGKGDDFRMIDLYAVDTGLLRELREHEKQAAQELGQWTEKQEIVGNSDRPLVVKVIRGASMAEL